ncbi:MAG: outer membrane protein assembly factor BamD [Victivallales bacterium]|nr:outer membrane protein assembly factor BamD [Victivallales bacterium]
MMRVSNSGLFWPAMVLTAMALPLWAGVPEANEAFRAGIAASREKNYIEAADRFMAAKLYADDSRMKVKALQEAAAAYRAAGMREKEFACLETMLNAYPGYIDFSPTVDREYQIGDDFFRGHRDPAYWSLRWVPWLTGSDLTLIVYRAALKHAPFSPYAPQAQLRVARLLLEDGKTQDAIKHLRDLIHNYRDSDSRKYGYLELINVLMQLARYGDGDGAYNREANTVMTEFLKKYPRAPEAEWVRKRILEAKDISAERLYNLARFYRRRGRTKTAERYLNQVLRDYPDTLSVDRSEALLSRLDTKYEPMKFRPEQESRYQSFTETSLPSEGEPIMIAPENSGGKWLLPIRDLGLDTPVKVKPATIQKDEESK